MKNKKGFEFSFNWLFAILVGAVIIFLAIYSATRFIKTERISQDTQLGKELGIILNPIETSLETGKISAITLPAQTRIFNDCSAEGNFGSQKISTATKSSIGDEWQSPGFPSTFKNKYIFSESIIEGDNLVVLSKQFEMPFKIADLIYIWPEEKEFCFVNPPNEIEDEIKSLQIKNINITSSKCRSFTNVCFSRTDCEIVVSLEGKSVKKEGFPNRVYFESTPLLYGAIFADPAIYECQISRLMKRASELSLLYYSKSIFLTPKGCASNLEPNLADYANKTFSLNSSIELRLISVQSEILRSKNEDLACRLF